MMQAFMLSVGGFSHLVGVSCPDDHLIYFRFLGRVLGKALFSGHLVKGHMVRTIYKHLLGWPITFEDIQSQDEDYYTSLKKLTRMEDVSLMCLDFTVTEDCMGLRNTVELVENGVLKEVTNDNLSDYLEANLRYRMLDRTKPQLTELLLGFFDIVPEPALTVFDTNELELILCGLPTINMEDWQQNTKYSGLYELKGKSDQAVKWFWDIVSHEFNMEMKARLLQFVTGTSGVPNRGFSVLQGIDGNIKKFTIHGVEAKAYHYPRAHTCFNRIDLPNYDSKATLLERLSTAITMSGVGFGIE
jgi:HECT-domain (ubiquitin-transferase)